MLVTPDVVNDHRLLKCNTTYSILCYSRYLHKGYKVSEREDKPVKGVSSSNPFYGHGIYSPRSEGSIYLPGREPSHVSDKPTKVNVKLTCFRITYIYRRVPTRLYIAQHVHGGILKLQTSFFFVTGWEMSSFVGWESSASFASTSYRFMQMRFVRY